MIPAEQLARRGDWNWPLDWRITCGGLLWIAALALLLPELDEALVVFAPLVIVPLGLRHIFRLEPKLTSSALMRAAQTMQFPAAVLLLFAFVLAEYSWAIWLAGPWLAVCSLFFLAGAVHLSRGGWKDAGQLGIGLALVLPIVAGVACVVALSAWRPLQYSRQILVLTGAHFHYAGFALPLIAVLATRRQSPLLRWTILGGIGLGVPLVGAGITWSAWNAPRYTALELAAVVLLVSVCMLLGIVLLKESFRAENPTQLLMRAVSGLSLLVGMVLAAAYAFCQFRSQSWLDIPLMIPLHGLTNAFGFALCGMFAWRRPLCRL